MGCAMRTKFNALRLQLTNLNPIHQGHRFAINFIPLIGLSNPFGYQKHSGRKSVGLQQRMGIGEEIKIAIVKRQQDGATG